MEKSVLNKDGEATNLSLETFNSSSIRIPVWNRSRVRNQALESALSFDYTSSQKEPLRILNPMFVEETSRQTGGFRQDKGKKI